MGSDTRITPASSSAPEAVADATTIPANQEAPETASSGDAVAASGRLETRGEHFSRKALRARLNGYAIATVALVAILIALAATNTARVKVNWLVGSSHVSLIWLVLVTAIVGWLLGLLASARLHWRTRAPRHQRPGRL